MIALLAVAAVASATFAVLLGKGIRRADEAAGITRARQDEAQAAWLAQRNKRRR